MTNKTVLSDEQMAEIAIKNCILLNNVSRQTAEEVWNSNDVKKNMTSVFREVEQAVLQSPEIQRLEKIVEAAEKVLSMPKDGGYIVLTVYLDELRAAMEVKP